jgi:hypothetical protein
LSIADCSNIQKIQENNMVGHVEKSNQFQIL